MIRACLETPWSPGDTGKGLLIQTDKRRLRLLTWRTLAWGGPHHMQAQEVLGLSFDEVAAYIDISEDGTATNFDDNQGLMEKVLELDGRLRMSDSRWRFD